jgi:GTP-binding protein HflX
MAKNDFSLNRENKKGLVKEIEKAVMVGILLPFQEEAMVKEHLDELEFLALTAGATVVKRVMQRVQHPDPRSFIGSGKVKEIAEFLEENEDISMVIFDDDLSGKQTNHLEEALKVKIIDRSTLILDIFAERAQTAQAKTQVELAQMQYLLPRLRGLWTHLERQQGGIGMRGPGEKEIETDRRIVKYRVSLLKEELQKIDRQAITQRKNRGEMIRVALVGYTNVGKSTLMNLLSKSEVFAENKLFATLDTTVRKVVIGSMPFLLSDTVGFIRKLPHHLIESFKSTLDEVRESDLLIHVVDIAHPQHEEHMKTVQATLQELGAGDKPMIMVFNKVDLYQERYFDQFLDAKTKKEILRDLSDNLRNNFGHDNIFISATKPENIDALKDKMAEKISILYQERFPYRIKEW